MTEADKATGCADVGPSELKAQLDSGWIPNTGPAPLTLRAVDIKLSCDEPNWPGVECIRYSQDPLRWDWQRSMGGTEITHYRASPGCKESNALLERRANENAKENT